MLNDFAPSGEMDTEQLEKARAIQLTRASQIRVMVSFTVLVCFGDYFGAFSDARRWASSIVSCMIRSCDVKESMARMLAW